MRVLESRPIFARKNSVESPAACRKLEIDFLVDRFQDRHRKLAPQLERGRRVSRCGTMGNGSEASHSGLCGRQRKDNLFAIRETGSLDFKREEVLDWFYPLRYLS
jgi:hypothetical protein